ncbi:7449_t:CDS:2 [Diversispora eburnea]|uniref:7449_t:CDS:1 n=1 Tax=Diversispora eburnea TaxID=1213867 RepID=A0A9N9A3U2_9GLOM|nr:7449_t:CDS:2 [Diversispora eburnea]
MVAHKWHNEPVYTNKTWSELTHIPLIEINKLEIALIESLNYKIHIGVDKYSFWIKCLTEYAKTGRLVSLFVERISKNTTPSPPPPPGFGLGKSRIIPTPIGYERNQYRLYELFDGIKIDFFKQTQHRLYNLYDAQLIVSTSGIVLDFKENIKIFVLGEANNMLNQDGLNDQNSIPISLVISWVSEIPVV